MVRTRSGITSSPSHPHTSRLHRDQEKRKKIQSKISQSSRLQSISSKSTSTNTSRLASKPTKRVNTSNSMNDSNVSKNLHTRVPHIQFSHQSTSMGKSLPQDQLKNGMCFIYKFIFSTKLYFFI